MTISPDGVLICGRRRLEAVKRLGWNTVRVWVRTGLSDKMSQLLAEHDENATHKPLTPLEAAALFREMKVLLTEDANRRRQETQFGAEADNRPGQHGGAESAPPQTPRGKTRVQAARLVTRRDSHQQLERISEMERVAADANRPAHLRQIAEDELEAIRNGGAVDPSFQRLSAALKQSLLPAPPESEEDVVADAAEERERIEGRTSASGQGEPSQAGRGCRERQAVGAFLRA